MLEINLRPGAKRRKSGPSLGLSFSMPSLSGLPDIDRAVLGVIAAWIVGPAVIGWLFVSISTRKKDLRVEIDQAVEDSARYARIIDATERMRARQDTIAEKLEIIEEIDAGRYIWPHIMDEVSRALPEYTWIEELYQIEPGGTPQFRIDGYTGTTLALTRYMRDLEASPFIRGVTLASSELVRKEGKLVYIFRLDAEWEAPPESMLDMAPLFISEE